MTESGLNAGELEEWLRQLQFDDALCFAEGEWRRCPELQDVLLAMGRTRQQHDTTHQGAAANFIITRGTHITSECLANFATTTVH